MSSRPWQRALSAPFGPTLAVALLVLAAALVLRHVVIEPTAIAHACQAGPWSGGCALRSLVILTFANREVAWIALGCGVLATALRSPVLAAAALAGGAWGLVLYSYEPAAVAALLGLLVAVRAAHAPASTSSTAA
jgi:hypothetical protein